MKRTVAVLALVFAARAAFACSCVGPAPVDEARANASIVFAGVVESIHDVADGRKVTFRTLQWWKGDTQPRTIVIWTGRGGGDCGYPAEAKQSYLVYGDFARAVNRFTMHICSRTESLVCALDDVKLLGKPIKTYEAIDRNALLAREQPYTPYQNECLTPAQLIGERGLNINKHCSYVVEGIIGRDGFVRDFRIVRRPKLVPICPETDDAHVAERVAQWRFKPATIDGVPVEIKLTRISASEPYTERELSREKKE